MRRTRPTTGLQADDIKRAVTMPDLLERLGMDPPRQGFILCPFHPDSDASLKVYQGDRGWHCFGCGQGGSVIDFVMQYLGLSFSDAVQELGRMYGLVGGGNPVAAYTRKFRNDQQKTRRRTVEELHERAHKILVQEHDDFNDDLVWACQNVAHLDFLMELLDAGREDDFNEHWRLSPL